MILLVDPGALRGIPYTELHVTKSQYSLAPGTVWLSVAHPEDLPGLVDHPGT